MKWPHNTIRVSSENASRYASVPQWPSDISGNDWIGPINSSPAADRMSDEIFGENLFFLAEI